MSSGLAERSDCRRPGPACQPLDPFSGDSLRVLVGHLTEPPPPFAARCPERPIPPAVEQVIMRCLKKDPDQRFQTVAALARAGNLTDAEFSARFARLARR